MTKKLDYEKLRHSGKKTRSIVDERWYKEAQEAKEAARRTRRKKKKKPRPIVAALDIWAPFDEIPKLIQRKLIWP